MTGSPTARRGRSVVAWLALAVYVAIALYLFHPLLECADRCFIALHEVHGRKVGHLELTDTRLNAWILAWSQKSLLELNPDLFDTNALYPALDTLAGSEHLLGLALPTLPLRLLSSNAVLIYQATLMLSFLVLAMCSFALVRWLGGSAFASIAAGAIAMLMPWRVAELTHLQLLGAHWFPLIWLLLLRVLYEGRGAVWLGVVLALQLLTSYYLAYILTLSLGVLLLGVAIERLVSHQRLAVGRAVRAAIALALPYLLLVLVSLPYLDRQSRGDLVVSYDVTQPYDWKNIALVWMYLAPRLETLFTRSDDAALLTFIPITVVVPALLALALCLRGPRGAQTQEGRRRVLVLSLWLFILAAWSMMLGSQLIVGDHILKLPSYYASLLVPGFGNLRAPHRWAIGIGIAMPILAGLGFAIVEQRLAHRPRAVLRVAFALLLVLNLPWRALPATPAFAEPERVEATSAALRELDFAPVLEVPWNAEPLRYVFTDTGYMLASTQHWRPILNGFTAYLPRSFELLRRIAQRLPDPAAATQLAELTGLRWIVVHLDQLQETKREAWLAAEREQSLRVVWRDGPHTRIFELPPGPDSGRYLERLRAEEPGRETLTGASRDALDLRPGAGQLDAELEGRFRFAGRLAVPKAISIEIANTSSRDWPGLDRDPEGLVALRYAFSDAGGRIARIATAPIDVDVPAHSSVSTIALLEAPAVRGEFELCLDLVQQRDGELVALPIDPVAIPVRVVGMGPSLEGVLRRLADAHLFGASQPEFEGVSRCAAERAKASRPGG